jgi:putative sterol carrier protein
VPAFLSDAWIADLDRAARAAPGLRAIGAERRLVVEQRVDDGAREVVYHFAFDGDGARVHAGPASEPDLVLITDEATARALRRGELNAQRAVAAGRLKIRGRPGHLRGAADALRRVEDVFRSVRDDTRDDDGSGGDRPRR